MAEQQGPIVWDADLYGSVAGTVPDLIDSTTALVTDFLNQNQDWAQQTLNLATLALANLSNAKFDGQIPNPPDPPTVTTTANLSGTLGVVTDPGFGDITVFEKTFNPTDVVVQDPSTAEPTYTRIISGVTIPPSPVFSIPQVPPAPGLDLTFDLGTTPVKDYGETPELTQINIPAYTMALLPMFNDSAPEFDTLPPDPLIQWVEPQYLSDIKDSVESVLQTLLAGGTGLPIPVETAIWERARQREDRTTLKTVSEATDQWTLRGFSHPFGLLNKQIITVREDAVEKANSLSREVAIEQARLEQANIRFGVEQGIHYEQVFTGLFISVVDRNFQIAKFQVETAIQIFNMQVTAFNTEQAVFAQKGERFRLQLESALAPLKEYSVLIEAEKTKAVVNQTLVAAFTAKVQAYSAQLDGYKTFIQAQTAKAEQQKLKVDLYRSQIEAMVAQVNVQRGAFEAYTAQVGGEVAKVQLESANASVFSSQVQGWSTLVQTKLKKAEIDIANNRLRMDWQIADMNRITTLNGQQLAVIHANLAGWQASLQRATAEAQTQLGFTQAGVQAHIELSRLQLGKYTAQVEQWKAHAQQIIQTATLAAESMRAAGQLSATLSAGAMAGTHVSAGISAGASSQQSRQDQKSESKGFSQSMSSNYSTTHTYPHKTS